MATIRLSGTVITAEPVMQYLNGDWLMRPHVNAARFRLGGAIRVKLDEIIEMAAAEMPADGNTP